MIKKGTFFIAIGLLLIAAALCLTGYNLLTERSAGTATNEALEELLPLIPEETPAAVPTGEPVPSSEIEYPDYILNPNMDMPVGTFKGHAYVGILSIPSLHIELPVLSEWSYPNLKIAPCRFAGTPYLGNMVICAHNYRSHFGPIKRLSIGDDIYFKDIDGNRFHYQVSNVEILRPTAVEDMQNSGYDLTLFTCTLGGRTRMTIRCDMVQDMM